MCSSDLAIKAADARKAARQLAQKPKSLLTPEEQESIAHAQELLTWDDESSVARFVETHCACGASHQTFDGWFVVSRHRRDASARRFRRSSWHEDLPAWRYVVLEEVEECVECLAVCGLPTANTADFPGIEALGICPDCDGGQLMLELEAAWEEVVEREEAEEDVEELAGLDDASNTFAFGSLNHQLYESTHQQGDQP